MLVLPKFFTPSMMYWEASSDGPVGTGPLTYLSAYDTPGTPHEVLLIENGESAPIFFDVKVHNDLPNIRVHWFCTAAMTAQTLGVTFQYRRQNPGDSVESTFVGAEQSDSFTNDQYDNVVSEFNLYDGTTFPTPSIRRLLHSCVADGFYQIKMEITDFPGSGDIAIQGVEVF